MIESLEIFNEERASARKKGGKKEKIMMKFAKYFRPGSCACLGLALMSVQGKPDPLAQSWKAHGYRQSIVASTKFGRREAEVEGTAENEVAQNGVH